MTEMNPIIAIMSGAISTLTLIGFIIALSRWNQTILQIQRSLSELQTFKANIDQHIERAYVRKDVHDIQLSNYKEAVSELKGMIVTMNQSLSTLMIYYNALSKESKPSAK